MKKPVLLCILDGVGLNPATTGNAWALARTPNLDMLMKRAPNAQLLTHGPYVGLPEGQMGGSEVGHLTMGAGRVIWQPLERIRTDLDTGDFASRAPWQQSLPALQQSRAIHLIGLLSDGGIHSHLDHLLGLCKILHPLGTPIFIHAITDGIDTASRAAQDQLTTFMQQLTAFPHVHLADICGRYYAMDRNDNWDRLQPYYNMLVEAEAPFMPDANAVFAKAASQDWDDPFIPPHLLSLPAGLDPRIQHGDSLIFTNFRADRMRQLVQCFIPDLQPDFAKEHQHQFQALISMTPYSDNFTAHVTPLYPPEPITHTLGEIVAAAGLTQLRMAETEKYAHVTYFFNGGREEPLPQEDRLMVASPDVATYDLQPIMSLPELVEQWRIKVTHDPYDLTVLNIANGDMVGHTGNLDAAIEAMEAVDLAVHEIVQTMEDLGGHILITADHGNVEAMTTEDGSKVTSHSQFPVPVIYIGPHKGRLQNGSLPDVAPTLLKLLGLKQPPEMTGTCLFV